MKLEKRKKFLAWYNSNYRTPFILNEELPSYCASDVRILSEALIEIRRIFLEETHFDVLFHSTTIASAVMQHYRANLMPEGQIGLCSELSYEKHGKQSTIARKYLK